MSEKRITFICRDCGSPEVRVDAYVGWNAFLQRNEIISEFDECVCEGDNGKFCNGHSTKCLEVSADQDCTVEHEDDAWTIRYPVEGLIFDFPTEKAAQAAQVQWREHVRRDVDTGEPLLHPHEVWILWGKDHEEGDKAVQYQFDTKAELDAFMKGVSEMDGWLEYRETEPGYVWSAEEDA